MLNRTMEENIKELLDSKAIYQILVNKVFIKPVSHSQWRIKLQRTPNCSDIYMYQFIKKIPHNRYKQLKFKYK